MDNVKYSIITVCFNEASNIRRTCESIRSQTVNDFEWIVIDGGSTDETLNILGEYQDQISYLVSEPDDGIYYAMNKGIMKATGEYLLFLNGGDCFASEQVLELVKRAPRKDILYGDLILVGNDGKRKTKTFPDILKDNYLMSEWMPHPSSFFCKRLFERYGLYDDSFRIAADYEYFVRVLFQKKATSYHLNAPLAEFRMDGISCQAKSQELLKKERHLIRKRYFSTYRRSFKSFRRDIRYFFIGFFVKRQASLVGAK